MTMSVELRLKAIVVNQLGVDEESVVSEARFIEDLGADSLDLVELGMTLEETFGIDIPDEDVDGLCTVGDAISLLEKAPPKAEGVVAFPAERRR